MTSLRRKCCGGRRGGPDGGRRRAAARAAGSAALAGLLLASLAAAATAQALPDPTRPPALGSSLPADAARLRPPRPAAPADRAAEPAPVAPQLQGLHLPASGLAMALIDGRLVKAGDAVGERRVASIDAQGVVLAGRGAPQRLELLGGTPKQAPGSLLTTQSARFVPAGPDSDPAPAGAERRGVSPPPPNQPGPLSVAGRTAP